MPLLRGGRLPLGTGVSVQMSPTQRGLGGPRRLGWGGHKPQKYAISNTCLIALTSDETPC